MKNFDLEYKINEFKKNAKELFNEDNKRYTGVSLSNREAELMYEIILECERELNKSKIKKNGMYGEMPKITIGKFTICMMTNEDNEDRIWIEEEESEGAEFNAILLEPIIKEFYNKNF